MAAFNKFESFVGSLGIEGHQLHTDTIRIYLTNNAPSAASDTNKADLAEIASSGSGYAAGGDDTTNTYAEASGTGTVTVVDVVWTASGGTIGPFRYVVAYNPNHASSALIGWWEYPGSASITLQDGETFTVDFASNALFTLA